MLTTTPSLVAVNAFELIFHHTTRKSFFEIFKDFSDNYGRNCRIGDPKTFSPTQNSIEIFSLRNPCSKVNSYE